MGIFVNHGFKVTQKYKPGIHNGIDVVANVDGKSDFDYVASLDDGEVISVRKDYNKTDSTGHSYGNYVKIKHANGMYTLYAHLKFNKVYVNLGDKVTKCQTIGYMGNTGYSNGAHTHFEVRNEFDEKIDPTEYLEKGFIVETVAPTEPPIETVPEEQKNNSNLKVGDKVMITKKGNGASDGTGRTAYGIGWTREILKIYNDRKFPFQVGNKTGTTGFYTEDALRKI